MMSTESLDEKVVRILIDALNRRELEPVLKLFAEEVVLHCPGKNRIAGEYRGRSEVLGFWRKQVELSGGTFKGNVISVSQGENQLVLISELSLTRHGKAYTWRRANHYQFYRNRVIEAWLYESDQYLADEAFG
jgi:hypothetical protein